MSDFRHYVEVIIKDGNRILSVECDEHDTVLAALIHNHFGWVQDTVRVNGELMPNNTLEIPLSQFTFDRENVHRTIPRVVIEMTAPKKTLPNKNTVKENANDDH